MWTVLRREIRDLGKCSDESSVLVRAVTETGRGESNVTIALLSSCIVQR
jgi:hypothetical protein